MPGIDLTVADDVKAADLNSTRPKTKPKKPRENGGRYGFNDYLDSPITLHDVPGVKPGDVCEDCRCGKYYYSEDRQQLEFMGGPILRVKRHLKKTLRCNRCGHEKFSHQKITKWSSETRSAIIIHKMYGMPWYRMNRVQKLFGIPVAISTLWTHSKGAWENAGKFVVSELYRIAIEDPLWGTDDTGAKILSVLKANEALPESERRACHTTAICTMHDSYKINLYITANRYCRENWTALLAQRKNKDKVIIATDASNQSLPKKDELDKVVSAVCLGGHARRKFTDLEDNYPAECGHFLNLISHLYKNEELCKDKTLTDRLTYHQENSGSIIDAIYARIAELFDKKLVEPNSDLGGAMQYWLNHKEGLTAFLRVEGAPLDTNWVERALRIMAVYRKASLFFKTEQSALILNDLFSLVSTCEANRINAFQYLTWIQDNWKKVQENPAAYLPWCFKQETERIAA